MLRYPHASAAGKLMLAEIGDSAPLLPRGPLTKLTQHTITESAQLEAQFGEIRLKGEASEINELEQGSASLALPVRLPGGPVGAALCLSGPSERFTTIYEHAEAAREVSTRLAPLLF
jgi:DNA-binding IclR family transcriptional regulator